MMLTDHSRKGEFVGSNCMRMGENLRSDLISQDSLPSSIQRGEHLPT